MINIQQIAYHGTGKYFDRFDPKFLGSGEGVQKFGPGFYFTSRPEIADHWRHLSDQTGDRIFIHESDPDEPPVTPLCPEYADLLNDSTGFSTRYGSVMKVSIPPFESMIPWDDELPLVGRLNGGFSLSLADVVIETSRDGWYDELYDDLEDQYDCVCGEEFDDLIERMLVECWESDLLNTIEEAFPETSISDMRDRFSMYAMGAGEGFSGSDLVAYLSNHLESENAAAAYLSSKGVKGAWGEGHVPGLSIKSDLVLTIWDASEIVVRSHLDKPEEIESEAYEVSQRLDEEPDDFIPF